MLAGLVKSESSWEKGMKEMSEGTKKRAELPPVGARATRERTITDAVIVRFADVSGDRNPVHLDEEYAARSPFGRPVTHGFLTGPIICSMSGRDIPGSGSIYFGQTMTFLVPDAIVDTPT